MLRFSNHVDEGEDFFFTETKLDSRKMYFLNEVDAAAAPKKFLHKNQTRNVYFTLDRDNNMGVVHINYNGSHRTNGGGGGGRRKVPFLL